MMKNKHMKFFAVNPKTKKWEELLFNLNPYKVYETTANNPKYDSKPIKQPEKVDINKQP